MVAAVLLARMFGRVIEARPGGAAAMTQRRLQCASIATSTTSPAFTVTRKRRNSFPSETHVKRGRRIVHGDVELFERLGRNDLCPCGSGARFQALLHEVRPPRRQ
jgi:uncharacterized protein YecA (UPF0149 family)